jgi:hypothetical protein
VGNRIEARPVIQRFDLQSEKMLELTIADGTVVRAGNQFGVGMKHD